MYKVDVHRRFVRGRAVERGLDFGHVWRVREEVNRCTHEIGRYMVRKGMMR